MAFPWRLNHGHISGKCGDMIGEMSGVRVPIVECTTLLASGRLGVVVVTTDGEENERPSLGESGRVCRVYCVGCGCATQTQNK